MACDIFQLVFLRLDVPVSCGPKQDTVRSNVVFSRGGPEPFWIENHRIWKQFTSFQIPCLCISAPHIWLALSGSPPETNLITHTRNSGSDVNLLLTHANTIQHHSLGCCYNHIQSIPINRLNRSLRPFILQWIDSPTPHLSNWAPGPGIGKKIDKRMMEGTESQKPFCTSNCCCTWSSSPASWEQVLLLFSSLQLVQLSSLELPYWDRSPATLVVLTCKILLVRGIWETRNGSSYCSFMFTFVWVDNGQPENWHNTSKAPTCHQKNKSFKKCRSFFGSFASLVSFVSFTSFTSFVSLASFTSFTSSAGSALRMAWAVCYDVPATSSNRHGPVASQKSEEKNNILRESMGRLYTRVICTWRSSMQFPCIGFY